MIYISDALHFKALVAFFHANIWKWQTLRQPWKTRNVDGGSNIGKHYLFTEELTNLLDALQESLLPASSNRQYQEMLKETALQVWEQNCRKTFDKMWEIFRCQDCIWRGREWQIVGMHAMANRMIEWFTTTDVELLNEEARRMHCQAIDMAERCYWRVHLQACPQALIMVVDTGY